MPVFTAFRHPIKSFKKRYLGHPVRLFTAVVKGFFIGHFIQEYYYTSAITWGPSMLPTLEVVGDHVIVSRWYRRGRGIEVGDIVSFRSVINHDEFVIKRVIGMEGDYVLRDTPGSGSDTMIQIPQGHCWVVGDNMPASRDSRTWGPLPLALIRGKIIAKIGPWSERKWIVNGLQAPSHD